jgi:hypothetical protein
VDQGEAYSCFAGFSIDDAEVVGVSTPDRHRQREEGRNALGKPVIAVTGDNFRSDRLSIRVPSSGVKVIVPELSVYCQVLSL